MITDRQCYLSYAQAVTSVAANPSADYYDMLSLGDMGVGEPLWAIARVNTTCTSGGSATVAVKLQVDDNTSFSSATDLPGGSAAIAVASLVAGYEFFKIRLPPIPAGAKERYLQAVITVGTAALTAGKFDIFLVRDADTTPATVYPRAAYPVA